MNKKATVKELIDELLATIKETELSPLEKVICKECLSGVCDETIADRYYLTMETLENYKKSISEKLMLNI